MRGDNLAGIPSRPIPERNLLTVVLHEFEAIFASHRLQFDLIQYGTHFPY